MSCYFEQIKLELTSPKMENAISSNSLEIQGVRFFTLTLAPRGANLTLSTRPLCKDPSSSLLAFSAFDL